MYTMFLEFLPFQKLKYTHLYVPNSKVDFGICIVYVTTCINWGPSWSWSWWGVLDTTLYHKVCQQLLGGFLQVLRRDETVSSINKTDHHDIPEILLKVTLNSLTLTSLHVHKSNHCNCENRVHACQRFKLRVFYLYTCIVIHVCLWVFVFYFYTCIWPGTKAHFPPPRL
jgi:hypothetical protein